MSRKAGTRILTSARAACAALLTILIATAVGATHPRVTGAAQPADARSAWTALAEEYFDDVYFKFNPTAGTSAGLHQFDPILEDYSRDSVTRQINTLHDFEKRVAGFDVTSLNQSDAADQQLVLNDILGTLLTLETIRPWEKNPDIYPSGIANSVFTIMSRKFAPPNDRLRSVVAREKAMPVVFAAALENLRDPPRVYTEIAIEQLPGTIDFFKNDVPAAFADASDEALKTEFAKSNAAVVAVLENYLHWLKTELLPRSNGDFRIGADTFANKLQFDEMVDIPLDKLLQIGWGDLRKNQAAFGAVAKELDSTKTPRQILAQLQSDHPAPDHLLQSFRDTFDSLIAFIHDRQIIDIPSQVRPTLEETPPFMRATTFASMDTPGPFETVANEAYFNVTLPDPHAPAADIAGFMASFNRGTIVSTSVHEAYPGHYVQFLWMHEAPSKVRMLIGANTNAEGWAHYCEQMMLDEGYGQPGRGAKNARDAKFIRLGQLEDALLRDARFIAGIEMHTGNMSFDDAVDFFVKEGYQSRETALVETKRGTSDPTYLYYTLGKLQILKLREDVRKKEGAAFTLEKFHDDFMRQGFPPIKIVRQALLGDNSPTL